MSFGCGSVQHPPLEHVEELIGHGHQGVEPAGFVSSHRGDGRL